MSTWAWILSVLGGSVVVLVLLIVIGLKVVLPRLLQKGVGAMFAAKAAALKEAEMLVTSVSAADGPPRAAFDNEEDHRSSCAVERDGGRWVRIEVTVTPKPPSDQGFTHWDPDELSLTPTPASGKLDLAKMEDEIECFVVRPGDAAVEDDEELDDMKIQGPCEVVLTAYVPRKLSSISVHYYTELVGAPITLPS